MGRIRVIPALLIKDGGLYKGQRFKDFKYVGDPINAIKIFNDKEVDELCVFDISATTNNKVPDYKLIQEFASECFMPCCYGGGINKLEHAQRIFELGIEKVSISSGAFSNTQLIGQIANQYGASSTVVTIDYKKNLFGKTTVYTQQGNNNTKLNVLDWAKTVENAGAGEIILNSIDKDGLMTGYDLDMINAVSKSVAIPVIALGGCGTVSDMAKAVQSGASAVAAGSTFVFHGKLKGVLINFPGQEELKNNLY
jgi:imidazole glycerol-phosphate synthase subunit HisF